MVLQLSGRRTVKICVLSFGFGWHNWVNEFQKLSQSVGKTWGEIKISISIAKGIISRMFFNFQPLIKASGSERDPEATTYNFWHELFLFYFALRRNFFQSGNKTHSMRRNKEKGNFCFTSSQFRQENSKIKCLAKKIEALKQVRELAAWVTEHNILIKKCWLSFRICRQVSHQFHLTRDPHPFRVRRGTFSSNRFTSWTIRTLFFNSVIKQISLFSSGFHVNWLCDQ